MKRVLIFPRSLKPLLALLVVPSLVGELLLGQTLNGVAIAVARPFQSHTAVSTQRSKAEAGLGLQDDVIKGFASTLKTTWSPRRQANLRPQPRRARPISHSASEMLGRSALC